MWESYVMFRHNYDLAIVLNWDISHDIRWYNCMSSRQAVDCNDNSWLSAWLYLERTMNEGHRCGLNLEARRQHTFGTDPASGRHTPLFQSFMLEGTPLIWVTLSARRTMKEGRLCISSLSAFPHLVSTSISSIALKPSSLGFQHRQRKKESWEAQPRGTEQL